MANSHVDETSYWDADKVKEQSKKTVKKKRKKKYRLLKFVLYVISVAIVSSLLAGIGWLLFNDLCSLNKDYKEVTLVVNEGDTVKDVAGKLHENGLVDYKWFFQIAGKFLHAEEKIDPGEYTLNTEMDYRSLISNMHDYKKQYAQEEGLVRLTIIEGMTVNEIIDLLVDNGISTKEELVDACANYEFKDYGFLSEDLLGSVTRMEGYLFPDTYDFDPNRSAVFAVDTMLTGFVSHISEELNADILNSGYDISEIVTMASIIEKEGIGDEEERKNIASVLYNRMNTKEAETYGYLQLDTTIYYALYLQGKDKTAFDKNLDSPYNTYLHDGLPVGPICNPGLSSIEAAANPNETSYYYFAAGVDGVNHFFKTYNDHVNFVNSDQYQPD